MALTTPTITCCKLNMNVQPAVVDYINEYIPINLNVFFNAITSMEVISGSYLPANNTVTLASGITTNPNFVILIVDSLANLTITTASTTVALQTPVAKLYFNAMQANTTYGITSISLDGTTAALVPMSQTTPVNYTLIYGAGIIN